MSYQRLMRVALFALLVPTPTPASAAAASTHSQIVLGRSIYQDGLIELATGDTDTDTDTSIVRIAGSPAPLALFPCAQCHGHHGEGREEAGRKAPALAQWAQRYSAAARAQVLAQLLPLGITAQGQTLDPAMPRYHFTTAQTNALSAYLAQLAFENPAGVSNDSLWINFSLPQLNHAVASRFIQSYCADINQRGGIFRRQLQCHNTNEVAPKRAISTAHHPAAAFLHIDLRGPHQAQQSEPPAAFVLRLFAQAQDNNQSASLWPSATQQEQQLAQLALQHYALNPQQLQRIETTRPIAFELQGQHLGLLQIDATDHVGLGVLLKKYKDGQYKGNEQAPILLLDHWLDALQSQAAALAQLSQHYPAPIHALVPDLPQQIPRELGLNYQALRQRQHLPDQAQAWQLWSFALLEQVKASLEQSGRQLSLEGFQHAWEEQQGKHHREMIMVAITP